MCTGHYGVKPEKPRNVSAFSAVIVPVIVTGCVLNWFVVESNESSVARTSTEASSRSSPELVMFSVPPSAR